MFEVRRVESYFSKHIKQNTNQQFFEGIVNNKNHSAARKNSFKIKSA
jgi:hypothetical protein